MHPRCKYGPRADKVKPPILNIKNVNKSLVFKFFLEKIIRVGSISRVERVSPIKLFLLGPMAHHFVQLNEIVVGPLPLT